MNHAIEPVLAIFAIVALEQLAQPSLESQPGAVGCALLRAESGKHLVELFDAWLVLRGVCRELAADERTQLPQAADGKIVPDVFPALRQPLFDAASFESGSEIRA